MVLAVTLFAQHDGCQEVLLTSSRGEGGQESIIQNRRRIISVPHTFGSFSGLFAFLFGFSNWDIVVALRKALGVMADAFLLRPAERPPRGVAGRGRPCQERQRISG
jgi:hypothetical protein